MPERDQRCATLALISSPYFSAPTDWGACVGFDGSQAQFAAFPYVHGDVLSSISVPAPVPVAERIAVQISLGLAALHDRGVVHGDLSVGNVVVHETSIGAHDIAQTSCVLIDPHLGDGAGGATLQYMSPELSETGTRTLASDLYALGCVLYRVSCGELPFNGGSAGEILRSQRTGAFRPCTERRPDLPARLTALIDSLLSPSVRFRPSTIQHVLDALGGSLLNANRSTFRPGFLMRPALVSKIISAFSDSSVVELSGAARGGTTTVLRDVASEFSDGGATIIHAEPSARAGSSISEQMNFVLARELGRQHAQIIAPGAALDDLEQLVQKRRVLIVIDNADDLTGSERSYLGRTVSMSSVVEDQKPLILIGSRSGAASFVANNASVHVPPLTMGELRSFCELLTGERLSMGSTARLLAESSGAPGRAISILTRQTDALPSQRSRPVSISSIARVSALEALAVWALPVAESDWERLTEYCGPVDDSSRSQICFERGAIVVRQPRQVVELRSPQWRAACTVLLDVFDQKWKSDKKEELSRLLRLVSFDHSIERRRHRIMRAIIILLRHGEIAGIEQAWATLDRQDAAPNWLAVLVRAARVAAGDKYADDLKRALPSESVWSSVVPLIDAWEHFLGRRYDRAFSILQSHGSSWAARTCWASTLAMFARVCMALGKETEVDRARRAFQTMPCRSNMQKGHRARVLFHVCLRRKKFHLALKLAKLERGYAREMGWRTIEAACENNVGVVEYRLGRRRHALRSFQSCVALRDALSDERGLIRALNNVLLTTPGTDDRIRVANRIRRIATRNDLNSERISALINVGIAYADAGRVREARRAWRQARSLSAHARDAEHLAQATYNSGRAAAGEWRVVAAFAYAKRLRELDREDMAIELVAFIGVVTETRELVPRQVELDKLSDEARTSIAWACGRLREHRPSSSLAAWLRRRGTRAGVSRNSARRLQRASDPDTRLKFAWVVEHLSSATASVDEGIVMEALTSDALRAFPDLRCELLARYANYLRGVGREREARVTSIEALQILSVLELRVQTLPHPCSRLPRLAALLSGARSSVAMSAGDIALAWLLDGHDPGLETESSNGLFGDVVSGNVVDIQQILTGLRSNLGAERVAVVESTSEGEFRVVAAEPAESLSRDVSWGTVSLTCATGTDQVHRDVLASDELSSHRSIENLRLKSVLCVPVRLGERMFGVLYADHRSVAGLFSKREARSARLGAKLIAFQLADEYAATRMNVLQSRVDAATDLLVRRERSAVVSEAALGLVHDLKNVVTAILGKAQLARMKKSQESDVFRSIERAAGVAVSQLARLQNCAQDDTGESTAHLQEAIEDAVDLARVRAREKRVRFLVSVDALPPVVGSTSDVRDVFLNLFVNACDAVSSDGCIELNASRDEETVTILVRDDGPGMPAGVSDRIFDPFFSTKGKSGSGLGLVVARNTMAKIGGSIRLTETGPSGTEFRLTFRVEPKKASRLEA